MPSALYARWRCLGGAGVLALLLVAAGCDTAPGAQSLDPQPPRVADFGFDVAVVPPPDPLPDTLAAVQLDVALRASDPDGRVERVEVALEPAQAPRAIVIVSLPAQADDRFGGQFVFGLPVIDEQYTVRAYAVDNDSLLSNQARGQFRLVPNDDS